MNSSVSIIEEVQKILARYPNAGRDQLIPIPQEIQGACGYLSREAVVEVGKQLNIPTSKIYGVATFYNQFRFSAQGKYHIQICRGTACHVKGSAAILDALVRELKINPGETTRDGLFSLEIVACIGACGLAPVMIVNDDVYGRMTPDQVDDVLAKYK